jgi:hypothetical protein
MPFKSEAQHRKFRVLLRQGKITQNQFDEWMAETKEQHGKTHPIKALPERVKTACFRLGFLKTSGGPGSGVSGDNTDSISFLKESPLISIGYRKKFMDSNSPVLTDTEVDTSKIKYKGQEKMVPKKLIRMMLKWDEIKDKPVDLIKDENGDYHVIDGHHRALAAILLKEKNIKANIYVMR